MKLGTNPRMLALLVLGVLAIVAPPKVAAQRKFSFAYDQPHTTAYGIAADSFDAKLNELSGVTSSIVTSR